MNCGRCGTQKATARDGRRYCPSCRAAIAAASINSRSAYDPTHCLNGHKWTPETTISRGDRGRRCKRCRGEGLPQSRQRQRTLRSQATTARRLERDAWFDWVVIHRIIHAGPGTPKPGRAPTIAEWHEIFQLLPDLTNEEISRRCGVSGTAVKRYRTRVLEKASAA